MTRSGIPPVGPTGRIVARGEARAQTAQPEVGQAKRPAMDTTATATTRRAEQDRRSPVCSSRTGWPGAGDGAEDAAPGRSPDEHDGARG